MYIIFNPHKGLETISRVVKCPFISELGNEGAFDYPTDRFKAFVWVKDNVHYLKTVVPYIKERVDSIRDNSSQVYLESHITKGMNVHYVDAIRYDD